MENNIEVIENNVLSVRDICLVCVFLVVALMLMGAHVVHLVMVS